MATTGKAASAAGKKGAAAKTAAAKKATAAKPAATAKKAAPAKPAAAAKKTTAAKPAAAVKAAPPVKTVPAAKPAATATKPAAASKTKAAAAKAPAAKPVPAAAPPAATAGPQEGDMAPVFTLHASGSRTISSAGLAGQPYLLYFYPKADTPGCTKQACGIQEALPALGRTGITVIGVSPDPMQPIEKFARKYGLEFPLASDADQAVAKAYGVWVEKSMYGKTYMGMERSSFLVGADGRVVKVWRKVKPEEHAAAVLEAAKGLG